MFKFKALAMMVVTAAVGTAGAAESAGSEFFYQAPANTSAVTPHLGYRMLTTKNKGATQDVKTTGLNRLGASYEYGLNEMLSLGADLSFSSLETDSGGTTKPKSSGLEDPTLFLKGTSAMGFGRLRYGATLGLGFEKGKIETNGDTNRATGGFSLTPYIGADADVGPGLLGARLSYAFNFERTYDVSGADVKLNGGDVFGIAAFYEYMLSDMILGGALNYRVQSDIKQKVAGVETTSTKAFNPFGIDLYARIPVGGFDLLPRVTYDFSAGGDQYDKYDDLTLTLAGRVQF